ncbi:MAG: hypothetical protein KA797_07865 [Chitinophagales bacterium]|nr:hypothetical protein [Chitinophagales bacterium]
MTNELINLQNNEMQEAYEAKDIAHSLRRYLTSGSNEEEINLERKLNENKGMFKRFFPTIAQKEDDRINAETLRQIRKNKSEIMTAHHSMVLEATRIQANAIIQGLGVHLQAQLAVFATEKINSIVNTISQSNKEMTKKLRDDENEASKEYKNDPKYLDRAIKQIDKIAVTHMESMEELLDGAVRALKNKAGIN